MNKDRSPFWDDKKTNYFIGITLILGLMILSVGIILTCKRLSSDVEAKEIDSTKIQASIIKPDEKEVQLASANDTVEEVEVSNKATKKSQYYPSDVIAAKEKIMREKFILSESYIPSIDKSNKDRIEAEEKAKAEEEAAKAAARKSTPKVATAPAVVEDASAGDATESVSYDSSGNTYVGCYELTAYCPTGNPCANGNYPSVGYTVACNSLPLGTVIYIEGYGTYVVEDRGGMGGGVIDIFLGSYDECIQFGRRSANVYIVN